MRPQTTLKSLASPPSNASSALAGLAHVLVAAHILWSGCGTQAPLDSSADGGATPTEDAARETRDGGERLQRDAADGELTDPSLIQPPPRTTPVLEAPDAATTADRATAMLAFSEAPELGDVRVVPNRSSVRLYLPGVEGARDYRVFAVEDGVSVTVMDNREHVAGATITCAGERQRNQCDNDAVLPITYNTEELDLPRCELGGLDRRPHVPTELKQTVEVNGIGPDTVLVVEAIDRLCPFPGLFGSVHQEVYITGGDLGGDTVEAVVSEVPYSLQRFTRTFPVRTEAEIRSQYGSMIFNGQAWNMPTLDPSSPSFPESPYIRLAQPAPGNDPVVLARAVVRASPSGNHELPPGFDESDYFDDFDDPTDQPKLLRETDYTQTFTNYPIKVYETNKWLLYDIANEFSDFFVDRGQLHMVHGDTAQGSMTTQAMYPKRAVQLPTEPGRFLHVTYEVQRNETPRRYENFSLCGSDVPGDTYQDGAPRAAPLPRPGFMNEEDTAGSHPLGWNCLLLVGRGAGYGVVPGGDIASHADSSLKVTVISTHPAPPTLEEYDHADFSPYAAAFGPTQEPPFPKRYVRQIDNAHQPSGVWLDDVMDPWQRARFDVFVRRDRVVIYVEGQQRICQDLPGAPLTMAEGALGFWHVLYHSSAEFLEMRAGAAGDNPHTGQHHIMHNTPFADMRSYDNVGFRENVNLPSNFDGSRCYPD